VEIGSALLLLPVVKQILLNDLEVLEGLWERGPHIVGPVGGTITNHGSLEVDL